MEIGDRNVVVDLSERYKALQYMIYIYIYITTEHQLY